jgi:hypothetical protein
MRKRVLSEEHLDTLTSMNNLTFTFKGQGRDNNTVRLMNKYVRLRTQVLGSDHPYTLSSKGTVDNWKP